MATMIVRNGKRVTLSIEQKARLLTVFDIEEPGHLAVTSGTQADTAYVVQHNNLHATYCPCKATGKCAHKVAVDWHLEAERRAIFHILFNPCVVA